LDWFALGATIQLGIEAHSPHFRIIGRSRERESEGFGSIRGDLKGFPIGKRQQQTSLARNLTDFRL
jgi:hypothetical protein